MKTLSVSKNVLYNIYNSVRTRCYNKKHKAYHRYGGRGIKICKKWKNPFNFFNDMEKGYLEHCKEFGKKNTSLDRINNNKGYSKENCRWATKKEQAHNTSVNVWIEFKGETKIFSDWRKLYGGLFIRRLRAGICDDNVLFSKNRTYRYKISNHFKKTNKERKVLEKFIKKVDKLPKRKKEFIYLRYGLCGNEIKTLQEIANIKKISRQRVDQIIKDSIKQLSIDKI